MFTPWLRGRLRAPGSARARSARTHRGRGIAPGDPDPLARRGPTLLPEEGRFFPQVRGGNNPRASTWPVATPADPRADQRGHRRRRTQREPTAANPVAAAAPRVRAARRRNPRPARRLPSRILPVRVQSPAHALLHDADGQVWMTATRRRPRARPNPPLATPQPAHSMQTRLLPPADGRATTGSAPPSAAADTAQVKEASARRTPRAVKHCGGERGDDRRTGGQHPGAASIGRGRVPEPIRRWRGGGGGGSGTRPAAAR